MSRILGRDYKDVDETVIYTHDVTRDLNGSTISSASWAVRPSGLTILSQSNTTTTAQVKVSGGIAGQLYVLELTATLADGEIGQACHEVQVLN